MINADCTRSGSGFKLSMEGHAQHGAEGEDIVCAAVSSIFYSLCGYIINFRSGSIKVNALESGLADIECGFDCEESLKLACLGLWQIANTYPSHLKVGIGAWNWKMITSASVSL